MRRAAALAACLALAACMGEGRLTPPSRSPTTGAPARPSGHVAAGVVLHPLHQNLREACLDAAERTPILCPALFPRRTVEPRSRLTSQQLPFGRGLYGVEIGYSAPYDGQPARNRPERFLHFVIIAGTGSETYDVGAESLGPATIGGRRGELLFVTEPSVHFDHVVFAWEEDGVRYQASLHAWDDRDATITLLRALVASLQEPDQI
jgi:hypothetical protein